MRAAGPGKRVVIKKDKNGTHYTSPKDGVEYPEVHAWWCRETNPKKGAKAAAEYLCIKQDNGDRADVVILSPGQVFDMIDALTHAVEHT